MRSLAYLSDSGDISIGFGMLRACDGLRNGEYCSRRSKKSIGGVSQSAQHFCWIFGVRGLGGGDIFVSFRCSQFVVPTKYVKIPVLSASHADAHLNSL